MKEKKYWFWILFVIILLVLVFAMIYTNSHRKKNQNKSQMNATAEIDAIEPNTSLVEEESEPNTVESLWDTLQFQTVMIQGDNIFGNGSIYRIDQEHLYIVTNDHLSIYVMNPIVYFFDGTSAVAINTENSEQLDMGILEVNIEDISKDTFEQLTCVSFSETIEPSAGMEVYGIGSTDGNVESKLIGTILAINEYHPEFHSFMTRCSGNVRAGMSGTGVFDQHGNYMGMISGAKDEEFVFLPVEIMKEEVFFGGE